MSSKQKKDPVKPQNSDEAVQELEECLIDNIPPPELLLKPIEQRREDARFWLAFLLIGTLCTVILFFLVLCAVSPNIGETVEEAFEKICFVLSPLVALVLGWYYRTSKP